MVGVPGLFDFIRGVVTKCRVKSFLIIAQLDVARDIFHGVSPRRIDSSMHPLHLQCGIE